MFATPNTDARKRQRVAIVTGGGRGIGREMAMALAKAGVGVVTTVERDPDEVGAGTKVTDAGANESRVLPLVADVSRPEDCDFVVDSAVRKFGGVDILVNNAARSMPQVREDRATELAKFWHMP